MNEKFELKHEPQPDPQGKDSPFKENQFFTIKDKLGYAEEYIIVKCDESNDNLLLNYSLSNSLEDIKTAIFNRTGLIIRIEKAKWIFNSYISTNVKHLMNKHQVSYSMTTYYEDKARIISINMRVGDNWFITWYEELKGKWFHWDYFDNYEKFLRFIDHYMSFEND